MDPLLRHIEKLHKASFGRVLDAGTGRSSLAWLCSLECDSWTAVTAEEGRAEVLRSHLGTRFRPQDRLLVGQWSDPDFLAGETFEVVLADYLLGSVERYAPHSQCEVLARLVALADPHLYITGLEPYSEESAEFIVELARFRDACHLLCGRPSHRELPLEWVLRRLAELPVEVTEVLKFQNHYDMDFVDQELRGLTQILQRRPSRLQKELLEEGQALRRRAERLLKERGTLTGSFDYLIAARKI
jgi:hypothetical protein